MPWRPIYKHAGIKVQKEKEEKKGAKKATTQQTSKQFYCYPVGNQTENKHFCPFAPKGVKPSPIEKKNAHHNVQTYRELNINENTKA